MTTETPQTPQEPQPPVTPTSTTPLAAPPPPPAAPPPPPTMRTSPPPPRRGLAPWQWGCIFTCGGCLLLVVLFIVLMTVVTSSFRRSTGVAVSGAEIALIRVEGVITSGGSDSSIFSGVTAGSDEIIRQLKEAVDDDSIRAIVLRVNSPGGSAVASQEIYDAIIRAKKAKTVVVSMADVAASGGYYISAPANLIYANPATTTGSIGVILEHEDISGLFKKIGVSSDPIKSGKFKDMLSPTRPMTEEERTLVQGIVMEVYDQFVTAVADGRKAKLSHAQVLKLADGRVYSGTQAKQAGLVDEVGGLHEALQGAADLAGITGEPIYKEYTTPSFLRQLFGTNLSGTRQQSSVTVTGGILYSDLAARLVPGPWQMLPTTQVPEK